MMQLTLNIVGKTLFDADVAGDAREIGRTITLLLNFSSDFRRLIFTPKWLPTRAISRPPGDSPFEQNCVSHDCRAPRFGSRRWRSFIDAAAARDEDGSRMDDKQLRDETLTLFLAGYETTANLLAWTWWLLATHPEVERKLHHELDGLLGGRSPSMDDLPGLRYAGHILTESLRLYPPAWGMARLAIEDHEIAGYPVPAGTGVAIAQWVVQPIRDGMTRQTSFVRTLGRRFAEAATAIRVLSIWRRPRQCIGNMFALMEATLVLATVAATLSINNDAESRDPATGIHYSTT